MNLAAILKFPLAILKMEKMRWLTRKYLQERFEEYNLKVSCLYPEVHDRLKKPDISGSTKKSVCPCAYIRVALLS